MCPLSRAPRAVARCSTAMGGRRTSHGRAHVPKREGHHSEDVVHAERWRALTRNAGAWPEEFAMPTVQLTCTYAVHGAEPLGFRSHVLRRESQPSRCRSTRPPANVASYCDPPRSGRQAARAVRRADRRRGARWDVRARAFRACADSKYTVHSRHVPDGGGVGELALLQTIYALLDRSTSCRALGVCMRRLDRTFARMLAARWPARRPAAGEMGIALSSGVVTLSRPTSARLAPLKATCVSVAGRPLVRETKR